MTAFDYSALAATATSLIDRFGFDVTISDTDATARAVIVSNMQELKQTNTPKQYLVNTSSLTILIEPAAVLSISSKLEFDGYVWEIMTIQHIKPATTQLLYKAQLKKAMALTQD